MQYKTQCKRRHEAHNHRPPAARASSETRRLDNCFSLPVHVRQKASLRCQMRHDLISKPMPTMNHGKRSSKPQQVHRRAHTYLPMSGVFCVILPIVLSRMAMIRCESIHHLSHLNHLNHRQQQPAPQQWSTPQAQLIKPTTTISSSALSAANHQKDALPITATISSNKTDTETELELKYPRNIKEIITSIDYDKSSFQSTTAAPIGHPLFNHQVQSGEPSKQTNDSQPAWRMLAASSSNRLDSTGAQPLMAPLNRTNLRQQHQPVVVFSHKTSSHQQLAPGASGRLESRIVGNFRDSTLNDNNHNNSFAPSIKGLMSSKDSLSLSTGLLSGVASKSLGLSDLELRKDNRVGDYISPDYENGFDANEAAELAAGNSASHTSDTQLSSSSIVGTSASLPINSVSSISSSTSSSVSASDESDLDVEAPSSGSGTVDNEVEQDEDTGEAAEQPATGSGSGSNSGVSTAQTAEGTGTPRMATQNSKTKKLRTARQQYSVGNISTGASEKNANPVVTPSEWFNRGNTKATTKSSMGDRHLIRARHLASRFSTLIRDGNANQSSGLATPDRILKARSPLNNNAEDHSTDNNVGYLLEDNSGQKTKKVFAADSDGFGKNRAYSSTLPLKQPSRADEELAMKFRQTNSRPFGRVTSSQELSASIENLLKHPAVSSSLPLILSRMDATAAPLNKGHLGNRPMGQWLNTPQPSNLMKEYKTNYTNFIDNYLSQQSTNRSPGTTRSPIRQRDLRTSSFLEVNDKQQAGVPIKDSFVPYYGSSSNQSLSNYHNTPFTGSLSPKLSASDSIVRSGQLMSTTNPIQYLNSIMPSSNILAQQMSDEHDLGYNTIRNSIPQQHLYNGHGDFQLSNPIQNFQHINRSRHQLDHMLANSNQLDVAHMGPGSLASSHSSDSSSYSSFLDYPDRSYDSMAAPPSSHQKTNLLMGSGTIDSGRYVNHSPQASTMSAMLTDDYRSHQDYQSDLNSYEPQTSQRGSIDQSPNESLNPNRASNSRSSQSDVYYRQETKLRDQLGGTSGGYPSRSSMASDPYEDVSNTISPVELEKDLTDLDEEFTRANFRRPSSSQSVDSYMPERYESRRYNSRRPSSYDTYSNDYGSGSGSSVVSSPRFYYRPYTAWPSSSYYDSGYMWNPDGLTGMDYSPLASYLNPNHYYRWRPAPSRYQRPYAAAAAAANNPFLAAAASESQQIHPAAYNLMPAAAGAYSTAGPLQPPTETISFSLSPLAAAAAAAAGALAAADKNRHHQHWLTAIPTRISTTALGPTLAGAATSGLAAYPSFYPRAGNPYAAAAALAAASMPMYALAPRSAANPLASAATTGAVTAAYSLPYPYGTGPLVAYRPTSAASLLAAAAATQGPLLGSASFAYPTAMRLPVRGFATHPSAALAAFNPKLMRTPYHGPDLQFAETKPKPNVTNNNSDNSSGNGKSPLKAAGTLTAMAKNLTRKMFGSSSQPRPSHVAPPGSSSTGASSNSHTHSASAALYDFFAPSHSAASVGIRRRR